METWQQASEIIHWGICEVVFHVKSSAICFHSISICHCFIWKSQLLHATNNRCHRFFDSDLNGSFHFTTESGCFGVTNTMDKEMFFLHVLNSECVYFILFSRFFFVYVPGFRFKFYTRQHPKVADTKLHTACSCMISWEWGGEIWGVNKFSLTGTAEARCGIASWLIAGVWFVFADCIRNQHYPLVRQSLLSLCKKL